jgi:hypothetical protein
MSGTSTVLNRAFEGIVEFLMVGPHQTKSESHVRASIRYVGHGANDQSHTTTETTSTAYFSKRRPWGIAVHIYLSGKRC